MASQAPMEREPVPAEYPQLRPWKKGQSGHAGYYKTHDFRAMVETIRARTRSGAELADYVISVLRNPKARTADRLAAATWLADRGWGKPRLMVEHSGPGGSPLFSPEALRRLSDTDLLKLQAAMGVVRAIAASVADNGDAPPPPSESPSPSELHAEIERSEEEAT
jgi:hypothetical protein